MAGALQHRATTLLLGIPAARAGGHHAEHADAAWSSRANRVTAAVSYNAALTFYPDHSTGAGHVQRLARDELLSNLPLERGAV